LAFNTVLRRNLERIFLPFRRVQERVALSPLAGPNDAAAGHAAPQRSHVLTKTEAREKALGRGWNIPEHDSQPSGQIEIVLDHSISGERRTTFSCAQQGGAESALPQVMKTLLKVGMRLQAEKNYEAERQRRQLEEAEKRRQEEQRRREQQARIAAEKKRRRELLHDAVRFRQAAALMELISAVEQRAAAQAVDTAACAEWLAYLSSSR
jgi:hypothetical protein